MCDRIKHKSIIGHHYHGNVKMSLYIVIKEVCEWNPSLVARILWWQCANPVAEWQRDGGSVCRTAQVLQVNKLEDEKTEMLARWNILYLPITIKLTVWLRKDFFQCTTHQKRSETFHSAISFWINTKGGFNKWPNTLQPSTTTQPKLAIIYLH